MPAVNNSVVGICGILCLVKPPKQDLIDTFDSDGIEHETYRHLFHYPFTVSCQTKTRNSSGDEIANVNFLYDDIVHALKIPQTLA